MFMHAAIILPCSFDQKPPTVPLSVDSSFGAISNGLVLLLALECLVVISRVIFNINNINARGQVTLLWNTAGPSHSSSYFATPHNLISPPWKSTVLLHLYLNVWEISAKVAEAGQMEPAGLPVPHTLVFTFSNSTLRDSTHHHPNCFTAKETRCSWLIECRCRRNVEA